MLGGCPRCWGCSQVSCEQGKCPGQSLSAPTLHSDLSARPPILQLFNIMLLLLHSAQPHSCPHTPLSSWTLSSSYRASRKQGTGVGRCGTPGASFLWAPAMGSERAVLSRQKQGKGERSPGPATAPATRANTCVWTLRAPGMRAQCWADTGQARLILRQQQLWPETGGFSLEAPLHTRRPHARHTGLQSLQCRQEVFQEVNQKAHADSRSAESPPDAPVQGWWGN